MIAHVIPYHNNCTIFEMDGLNHKEFLDNKNPNQNDTSFPKNSNYQ